MNTKAYLFAVIDTPSKRVTETIILSDEKPTVGFQSRAYALLSVAHGVDYADAVENMKQTMATPYWAWARRAMRRERRG